MWLGWVALIPLFVAIRVCTPGVSAMCGSLWGLSLFIFGSLGGQAPISFELSSVLLLLFAPGAYSYVGSYLNRSIGFSPYLLGLGWIAVEFALRPLGLRHGLLAGAVGDGFALRMLGSFAGYVLVAFLVAYVNAAILAVLAKVRASIPSSRIIHLGGDVARFIQRFEIQIVGYRFVPSAQPRAPPFLN